MSMPRAKPYFPIACSEKLEQEGSKLHTGPRTFDAVLRYPRNHHRIAVLAPLVSTLSGVPSGKCNKEGASGETSLPARAEGENAMPERHKAPVSQHNRRRPGGSDRRLGAAFT